MSSDRISALSVLSDAFTAVWREKELAILLMAFISIFNLIILWPIVDWYLAVAPTVLQEKNLTPGQIEMLENELDYILLWVIPVIFVSMATLVLWSRAAIGGTSIAFAGGIGILLKRSLWMLWRYICAIGWMILVFFPLTLVIGLLSGAAADASSGPAMLFIIIAYLGLLFLAMGVSLLMVVSFHGEARDFHLPIHKSFVALRGNILRAVGVLILSMVGFYIVIGMIGGLLNGVLYSDSFFMKALLLFILFFLGNILNFVWIAFGALYASKLVPELKT